MTTAHIRRKLLAIVTIANFSVVFADNSLSYPISVVGTENGTLPNICVSDSKALWSNLFKPTLFLTGTQDVIQVAASGAPITCASSMDYLLYNSSDQSFSSLGELPNVWATNHWSVQTYPYYMSYFQSGSRSLSVDVQNHSPMDLKFSQIDSASLATEGARSYGNQTYTVSGTQILPDMRTLPWISEYIFDIQSKSRTEQVRSNTIVGAVIVEEYDPPIPSPDSNNSVHSQVAYALIQPLKTDLVSFALYEASLETEPDSETQSRKLMAKPVVLKASFFPCPHGYCFPKAWRQVVPSCRRKSHSWPSCLYTCVCY